MTKLYGLDFAALNRSGLLLLRAWALAEMIRDGLNAPLLSPASHQGGWLAPEIMVKRAEIWGELDRTPPLPDLVLALLRLAPEGRAEALRSAQGLPGEWGAATRYALGGTEPIGAVAPLWVAACRARSPFADDPVVARAFPKLAAGGGLAATYHAKVDAERYEYFTIYSLNVHATPKLKDHTRSPLRVLKRRGREISALSFDDMARSATLLPTIDCNRFPGEFPGPLTCGLWPSNPDALFAAAALDSHGHEEEQRPAMAPIPAPLELLLDPEVALTPMALMLLCQALNARDSAEGQLAVDVLIAVIQDGRLVGPEIGATLNDLLKSGIIKPKRWIPRLKEVAQTSPLQVLVLRRMLEAALAGASAQPPRDIGAFLELLLELCIEGNDAPPDALRGELERFPGGRKAAKLARKLCTLTPGRPDGGPARRYPGGIGPAHRPGKPLARTINRQGV